MTAYKAATTNKARGHIENFQLGFKSRRSPRQICWARKNALTKDFVLFSGGSRSMASCASARRCSASCRPEHDFKILRDGSAYYLVLTVADEPPVEVAHPYEYVSMDPGVRTFQTCYSPDGVIIESDVGDRLQRLAKRADLMRSLKQRRRLLQLYRKIRDVATDLHYQTAALLTRQFKNILLPTFGTSGMKTGPLSSKTKRQMDSGLLPVRQRLIRKGRKRGCNVYIVGEEYTTKTHAVRRAEQRGSSKVYTCASCSLVAPRDLCGARNILLKHFGPLRTSASRLRYEPVELCRRKPVVRKWPLRPIYGICAREYLTRTGS